MKIKIKDRLGKINVTIDYKDDWIFFVREKERRVDNPVFFGMSLSVLKTLFDEATPKGGNQ